MRSEGKSFPSSTLLETQI